MRHNDGRANTLSDDASEPRIISSSNDRSFAVDQCNVYIRYALLVMLFLSQLVAGDN